MFKVKFVSQERTATLLVLQWTSI